MTNLQFPGIYLHKELPYEKLDFTSKGDEYMRKIKPKPILVISGDFNKKLLFKDLGILEEMHASISHEDDFAVATVTLEKLFSQEIFLFDNEN